MQKPGMTKAWGSALAAVLLATSHAAATGPGDKAAAVSLFQEAKQKMEAGDYAGACLKFAEAQRLLPTAGTLLNLGACNEKQGKLASAWGAYKEAEISARATGDREREQAATKFAAAVAPRVARFAIVVPPEVRAPGFELRRDGEVVGEAQWGSALPVDVGWHEIKATAPGRKPWSTSVRVETDGSSASVTVPLLEEQRTVAPSFWTKRRIAGAAASGAGLAGIVVGAVAGGLAAGKASSSRPHCQPLGDATACDPTGLALRSDVRSLGNVANVALALGGAAAVTGVVLLAVGRGEARVEAGPTVGAGSAGLVVRGVW